MKRIFLLISWGCFYASTSFGDVPWHNESELGITAVSGNTGTETYNGAQKTSYQFNNNLFKIAARYLEARANGLESARNWDGNLRYERILTVSISTYLAFGLESDVFSGYIQRNNYDLGGKYYLSQSKDTVWFSELGYRNSFTQYVSPTGNAQSSYLRLYSEVSQIIANGITGKLWVEYLLGLSDPNDYLFNAEPSLSVILSQVFSLKTAYLFKYHNIIPSTFTKRLDSFFTLSLVAKF